MSTHGANSSHVMPFANDTNSSDVRTASNDINSFSNIALAFLMSLLAFAIMLGNAVVILAFVVDKNLRHRSNYFFLNLAISDFFVGVISIPLFIPHKLFNWKFENNICVFWLTTDYLLCTASVYNIVLISFDRYQSVSNAVSYRAQHTGTLKTVTLMVAVWVAAFLVHGPILVSETRKELGADCKPEFLEKWHILALTLLFEFGLRFKFQQHFLGARWFPPPCSSSTALGDIVLPVPEMTRNRSQRRRTAGARPGEELGFRCM
ncbi:hypothetical protein R6Z07F_018201 [Ovis aries]